MTKVTLSDVANISGAESAAIGVLNANSDLITTAIENTLSRDGTTPNSMSADFDMGNNDILNVDNIDVNTITIDGVPVAVDSTLVETGSTGGVQGFKYDFNTVSILLSDTIRTYSNTTAGDYIRTRSEGFAYMVAASGASDHHVTTGGGLKLYERSPAGYHVDAFGAIGDGVTNDYTALNTARQAAEGDGVMLHLTPGKSYLSSSVVDITCRLEGHGASILGQVRLWGDNTGLENVNIISPTDVYGLFIYGQSAARIANNYFKNSTISFSGGTAATRLAIQAQYCDDLVIEGNIIDYGINLVRCRNYRVESNIFDGNSENEDELLHATVRSYGQIIGNSFLNSYDNWIDLYSSGERTLVANNRFSGCLARLGTGFEIKVTLTDNPDNTSGGINDNGYTREITVIGNIFEGFAPIIATQCAVINIYYLDTRAAPSFSWADVPRNILIADNQFCGTDTTLAGGSAVNAISLLSVEGVSVINNVFSGMSAGGTANNNSSCVWVEKCRNVIISGNRGTVRDGTGVSLHDECDMIQISDNQFVGDGTGVEPAFGIQGCKIGSRPVVALTNISITGNIIQASLACCRVLYTAGTIAKSSITGNVFDNETVFDAAQYVIITGNKLGVRSTRFRCLSLGYLGAVDAKHNTVTSNTLIALTGKQGIEITRCRASIFKGNTITAANYGIVCTGTTTANELDNLIIKDNISVSQAGVNFPLYSTMSAADTALLQADTNLKVT